MRGFGSQNLIVVQGAAQAGSAVLLDAVGTDSYTVRSSNDALARGTVADPGRAPDGRGRPAGGSPEVTAYADGPVGASRPAGRTVHFTLQIECDASASIFLASCNLGDVWSLVWQVDAVTDDAGIARACMPLLRTGLSPDRPWRVVATFDDEKGLHPRHAARELTLTE